MRSTVRAKDSCALTLQERLRADLLGKIERGELAPGEQLPSENDLAESYGVSRVTVRAALNRLAQENVLVKRQGKGSFVKPVMHIESTLTSGSFTQNCIKMGCVPTTHVVFAGRHTCDSDVSRLLPGYEEIVELRRVRSVDGRPCILECDYFPPTHQYLLTMELENRSLFEILERERGVRIAGFEDQFRIVTASDSLAALLELKPGVPVLEVLEQMLGPSGELIYVNRQLIATDRYTYAVGTRKI